jgi:hypothetical protein
MSSSRAPDRPFESCCPQGMTPAADTDSIDRELDRLYGLAPAEFTDARNALARELKRDGKADEAARVQKLAKPTRSAGAINRVVRRRRRDAERLLDEATALGEAQQALLDRGDREAVESAVERERAAVDRLMEEVAKELDEDGTTTEAMLERARGTLHAVATDADLRDEFEAGRISKDHEAVGFGSLTLGRGRPAPKREAKSSSKPSPSPEATEARRRLKRSERELEKAQRAATRAESRRVEAEERLEAAEAELTEARSAVADAERERKDAETAVSKAQ